MATFYKDPANWTPPINCLPTNDDVIRFYISRIKNVRRDSKSAKFDLVKFVHKIWESADCCPVTIRHIDKKFETLYRIYKKYLNYGREKVSHQKKTSTDPPRQPTRKSRRREAREASNDNDATNPESVEHADFCSDQEPVMEVEISASTSAKTSTKCSSSSKRIIGEHIHKQVWMEDHGLKLFDVVSHDRLAKIAATKYPKNAEMFDSDYYNDQLDPSLRTRIIEVMKVTKEYYDQQRAREKSNGAKYARLLSAYGKLPDVDSQDEEDLPAEQTSSEDTAETEDDGPIGTIDNPSSITTRSGRRSSDVSAMSSESHQFMYIGNTQIHHDISTRNKLGSTLCHPAYLQSGLLMMALGNESPNQAVLNMYIHDTVVHQQKRILPLRLQKEYQRALHRMKRYRDCLTEERNQPVLQQLLPESVPEEDEDPVALEEDNIVEIEDDEVDDHGLNTVVAETIEEGGIESKTEKFVRETKAKQKENLDIVLPDPRSVREAHRVASSFLEGEIGKEMVKNKSNYLMPDGTSRAKVGKMGGSLVHIAGRVRALKMQKMGKDNRENWADTLIFKLKRLSEASNHTVEELYESIRGIVSDAASVNKGMAQEISSKLGLEWTPSQLYCCIHTVLGFQDGMVSLWLRYQEKIGQDKMYPSITGFELDMEEKCLIKQILECFLRITADRWQARSWNRFEAYLQYAKDNGMLNLGVELHGNRFGDLERCCAIGVYSLETWLNFINLRTDIRNNLAVFLRDTQHLNDICMLLWLGPALIGIHLTEPYLALLLEKQATHLDLLRVLPNLHRELNEYHIPLAQIKEPAFPSLKDGWINPLSSYAPYPKEIGQAISRVVETQDKELLDKYLKELCKEMAIILKRQRGNAYNFGDEQNSSELVSTLFTEEELKVAPTHSTDMENLFGVEDSILTRFGPQAFDKSTDDLIVKYSHDLLPSPSVWCTAKARKTAKYLQSLQRDFSEKQEALLRAGVTQTDAETLAKDTQVQKFVQQCRKSHGGPMNAPEEVDDLVKKLQHDDKLLRLALIKEIRYRKYSAYSIKFDNPLFKQQKCDTATLISNLKLLLMKTDSTLAAKATMTDLEAVIASGVDEDVDDSMENEGSVFDVPDDSDWPPAKGVHIAVNFTDGFYIGEVMSIVDEDILKVSYMHPKSIKTANPDEHPRRFWHWPVRKDIFETHRSCILNLKPSLELTTPPSTKKMLVFSCDNAELLDNFAVTVTEEL